MKHPFPLLPVPTQVDISRIYDPYGIVGEVLKYIETVVRGNMAASGIIVGNYGFGKTHLLLYIKNYIESNYDRAFTVYIPTPGQGFRDFYRIIMDKILSDYINIVIEYVGAPLNRVFRIIMENDGDATYLRQWVLGESVPVKYRQKYNLGGRVNEDRGLEIIIEILKALYESRHVPIVILVDEIEDIITYTTPKKIRYLNYLRILIDNLTPQSILLVASTPAGWTEVINTHPALARRLSSILVYLRPLDKSSIRGFLKYYMEGNNSFIDWIIDDEVIELLYEYSDGNPGEVLRYASILYTYALITGSERLNIESIKEVLSKYV